VPARRGRRRCLPRAPRPAPPPRSPSRPPRRAGSRLPTSEPGHLRSSVRTRAQRPRAQGRASAAELVQLPGRGRRRAERCGSSASAAPAIAGEPQSRDQHALGVRGCPALGEPPSSWWSPAPPVPPVLGVEVLGLGDVAGEHRVARSGPSWSPAPPPPRSPPSGDAVRCSAGEPQVRDQRALGVEIATPASAIEVTTTSRRLERLLEVGN
jgi:hypothetical protein